MFQEPCACRVSSGCRTLLPAPGVFHDEYRLGWHALLLRVLGSGRQHATRTYNDSNMWSRILAALCFPVLAVAQLMEAPDLRPPEQPNMKTLLAPSLIDAMVAEISGSVALNHLFDIAGYEHDRFAEEYRTVYRESAYVERMAKRYGLEDVHIERFPLTAKQWDGELGELWMTAPARRLIISYRDVVASLATGSKTADVTAELVYCGRGSDKSDYVGKNLAGKIVLISGSAGPAAPLAVKEFGAAGIVSFSNRTGKPIDRPDQIAWGSAGAGGTFAFNLSHRAGVELVELLEKGEKVTVRARVKAAEYDADMQVPTAVIRGDGSTDQEVVLAAHLFEGIAKQGGMDNGSGSALILEVARAWKKLVDEGILPRPRRTVRFLWVPEISGTIAYLRRYPDAAKKTIAAISVDMAGGDVNKSRNSFRMMRTPYSVNHWVNDVSQQFFEFVGDTNREKVNNRRIAYSYQYPILDPQGSRDQFYYNIEKHYGASDHVVYLGQGIPALLYNNWPDIAYHTNEDRVYDADATQLKRAGFIAWASSLVAAGTFGPDAVRVAEMVSGYAAERAGRMLGDTLRWLGDGGTVRGAVNRMRITYGREADAIRSAKVFAGNDSTVPAKIDAMAATFAETGIIADTARIKAYAAARGIGDKPLTGTEAEASKLVPVPKPGTSGGMMRFGGGGSRGSGDQGASRLTGMGAQEARAFADGKRTVLDIADAVGSEFGAMDVKLFLDYFKEQARNKALELKAE